MKHLSESERVARNAGLFGSVQTIKGAEKQSGKVSTELSEDSLKVLVKAGLEPGLFLLVIYKALNMPFATGRGAVNDLEARGMVKVHRLVRKGRGGQPHVLEVLPAGKAELEKRGISPAEKKLKRGGWLHDVYARYVERWAREQGFVCWFERVMGAKAFDFVFEDEQRDLVAIEIYMSGLASWIAEQSIKGAGVAGVKKVIVACETKKALDAVLGELKKIDALGLYAAKIEGRLLGEFLP